MEIICQTLFLSQRLRLMQPVATRLKYHQCHGQLANECQQPNCKVKQKILNRQEITKKNQKKYDTMFFCLSVWLLPFIIFAAKKKEDNHASFQHRLKLLNAGDKNTPQLTFATALNTFGEHPCFLRYIN